MTRLTVHGIFPQCSMESCKSLNHEQIQEENKVRKKERSQFYGTIAPPPKLTILVVETKNFHVFF